MPDVMHQGSESQLLNVVFWYLIDMTKHMAGNAANLLI